MKNCCCCGCGCVVLPIVLVLIFALLLNSCSSSGGTYTNVSVDTLCGELSSNPARAKKQYRNKNLIVTGNIGGIQEDANYMVLSSAEYPDIPLVFNAKTNKLKEDILELSTGYNVTVKCRCTAVSLQHGYRFEIVSIE